MGGVSPCVKCKGPHVGVKHFQFGGQEDFLDAAADGKQQRGEEVTVPFVSALVRLPSQQPP